VSRKKREERGNRKQETFKEGGKRGKQEAGE
jgi:hypothetical protein